MLSRIIEEDLERISAALKGKVTFEGTVLITGAVGFLGCKFSLFFKHYGMSFGVDRLVMVDLVFPSWFKTLMDSSDIEIVFIEGDVADAPQSEYFPKQAAYVIHLATFASPVMYRKKPLETAYANVLGLKSLIEGVDLSSLRKMLLFSSSEIYGDPAASEIPTAETYNGNVSPIGPRACYDESKRFLETLAYIHSGQGIDITVVRPFNNFGPTLKLDDGRVIPDFLRRVLDGQDIEVFSDGRPTRTFLYSSDALIGYLLALNHKGFDVFNIGMDSGEVSISELSELVAQVGYQILGSRIKIAFSKSEDANYLVNNPQRRCPNIEKARKLLGFSPVVDLEEGLTRTLLHHSEIRNG